MEAETPCVELIYQQLVQLVARAFYAVNSKELLKEEQPEAAPLLPPGKKGKKPPVLCSHLTIQTHTSLHERFSAKVCLTV